MPNMDHTGPTGQGARTGRGMGKCGGKAAGNPDGTTGTPGGGMGRGQGGKGRGACRQGKAANGQNPDGRGMNGGRANTSCGPQAGNNPSAAPRQAGSDGLADNS